MKSNNTQGNPYHDKEGKFTSGNKTGVNEEAEAMKVLGLTETERRQARDKENLKRFYELTDKIDTVDFDSSFRVSVPRRWEVENPVTYETMYEYDPDDKETVVVNIKDNPEFLYDVLGDDITDEEKELIELSLKMDWGVIPKRLVKNEQDLNDIYKEIEEKLSDWEVLEELL